MEATRALTAVACSTMSQRKCAGSMATRMPQHTITLDWPTSCNCEVSLANSVSQKAVAPTHARPSSSTARSACNLCSRMTELTVSSVV
eukprot:6210146-Pleurochrysis_carterae.AAC.1